MNVPLTVAVLSLSLAIGAVAAQPIDDHQCYPTSGGMDYHSYLCYDFNDPRCPIYTLSSSDAGVTKRCLPA